MMKKIETRVFRIAGILQLGFPHLERKEIETLKSLKGFRFCGKIKMWHITYQNGILDHLNRKYEAMFLFQEDGTDRRQIEDIQIEQRRKVAHVKVDKQAGVMYVTHHYDTGFFMALRVMDGSHYDSVNRRWTIPLDENYELVCRAAKTYAFETDVTMIEKGMKIMMPEGKESDRKGLSFISKEEIALLERFERELYFRNRSNRTVLSYLEYTTRFIRHFHGRDFQEIRNLEIREYLNEIIIQRGYSYSTLNLQISAIRSFYNLVFNTELQNIDIPRPKAARELPRVLSMGEIQRMIESCVNDKHKLIITMLYSTGMRRAEILGLKTTDIDMESGTIRIHGKGSKDRTAYISKNLHKHLTRYLKAFRPVDYLFEGQKGQLYSETSIEKVIKTAAKRAGINRRVTPHMLRHSFATHLISKGAALPYVQKLLGHTNIKTTMIYTHIADNDLKNLPNPLDDMDL